MLPRSVRVWVATEPVDMRLGHDGLLGIVRSVFVLDPFSGHIFVFLDKRRDRCKILVWDRGGFVVYYKRLEKGRLSVRTKADGLGPVSIDATDLAMLLDGIDMSRHVGLLRAVTRLAPGSSDDNHAVVGGLRLNSHPTGSA